MKRNSLLIFSAFFVLVLFQISSCKKIPDINNEENEQEDYSREVFLSHSELITEVSTKELVNPFSQKLTITITVKGPEVNSIGYVYSDRQVSRFEYGANILENTNVILLEKNKDGKYIIEPEKNGYYYIGVVYKNGTCNSAKEIITNIDLNKPDQIRNINVVYSFIHKTLTLTWINPYKDNFDKTVVSCTWKNEQIPVKMNETGDGCTIENVVFSSEKYVFEMYVVDTAGNKSEKTIFIPETDSKYFDFAIFDSFSIPETTVLKKGSVVTALITGNGFEIPSHFTEFLELSFKTDSEIKNKDLLLEIEQKAYFTKIDDSNLLVTFRIPDMPGDYTVCVNYGENNIITGNLIVKDSKKYSTGDILLASGKVIPISNAFNYFVSDEKKAEAIGIIVVDEYGKPFVIGKYNTYMDMEQICWSKRYEYIDEYGRTAEADAVCCNTNLVDLLCHVVEVNNEDGKYLIAGDLYSYDNWDYMCQIDPERTVDPENNYPVFYYALNYGRKFNMAGEYTTGWNIPTAFELYSILCNLEKVNKYLELINGTILVSRCREIVNGSVLSFSSYYASSSQNPVSNSLTYKLFVSYNFSNVVSSENSYLSGTSTKGSGVPYYVCVVRPF